MLINHLFKFTHMSNGENPITRGDQRVVPPVPSHDSVSNPESNRELQDYLQKLNQIKSGCEVALKDMQNEGKLNEDVNLLKQFLQRLEIFTQLLTTGEKNRFAGRKAIGVGEIIEAITKPEASRPRQFLVAGKRGEKGGYSISPDLSGELLSNSPESWQFAQDRRREKVEERGGGREGTLDDWQFVNEDMSPRGLIILAQSLGVLSKDGSVSENLFEALKQQKILNESGDVQGNSGNFGGGRSGTNYDLALGTNLSGVTFQVRNKPMPETGGFQNESRVGFLLD